MRDLIPVAKNDKIYNYTAPANGLFDKVTEIFFTNSNQGGTYQWSEIGEGGAIAPKSENFVEHEYHKSKNKT